MTLLRVSLAAMVSLAALAPIAASAQSAGQRIALVNTAAFEDQDTGIKAYVNALKALQTEFAPDQSAIDALNKQSGAVATQIQAASTQDPKARQAKRDEYDKLQSELRIKQDDLKRRVEQRQQVLLGPIMQKISAALGEYARQKGYAVILDPSHDSGGLLLAVGDPSVDATSDFIRYYNARP